MSEERIDLSALLSCVSRDDLEVLVVQAIVRVPALYPTLRALVNKPVDTSALSSSLSSLLSFSAVPSALTAELEAHVDRAADLTRVGNVHSALAVLDVLTAQFVEWVRQHRRGHEEEGAEDEEQRTLESFFGLLVSAAHRHACSAECILVAAVLRWRTPCRTLTEPPTAPTRSH